MRFGIKASGIMLIRLMVCKGIRSLRSMYIDAFYILEVFCESECNYATLDSQT